MAINIRCKNCKADMKITTKKCKCGSPVSPKKRTYRIIVSNNGKRIIRTVSNLDLAKEIESALKLDIAREEHKLNKKPAPTLSRVWGEYKSWAEQNKPKSANTDIGYYTKHIEPIFGENRLDEINTASVENLIISMKRIKSRRGKPYAQATINHVIKLLSRLYTIASMWGLYEGINPCSKVKKPKVNNEKTEFLATDELRNLLETLESWPCKMSASFILFLLYTGMRRSELFKLTWDAVDFERKTILLRDPKGQKDTILPLSDNAISVLREVPREYETLYVFYGKNGDQRKDFRFPWFRIRKAAGLPENFRLHGLRHHFASSLVSAGVDLYTVSKLLTHKDVKTTQRYAHLSDKALRDAVTLSDHLQTPKKPAKILIFRG